MQNESVIRYDRAQFNRLVMQREIQQEINRRRHMREEADGQKSVGENVSVD